MNYAAAINSLHPTAKFKMGQYDDLSTLDWMDEIIPRPADLIIIAEAERLEKVFSDDKYKRDRTILYPSEKSTMYSIVKSLEYMQNNGVDIGPEGALIVSAFDKVDSENPKPL